MAETQSTGRRLAKRVGRALLSLITDPSRRRRAILAGACLALSTVPMAGTLGYFSCLILAPVLALLCTHDALQVVERNRALAPEQRAQDWPLLGLRGWAVTCSIPLICLLVGQLWTPNCDPWGGLLFYLMGPLASAVVGATAGMLAGLLTTHRLLRRLLAYAPFVFCLWIGLARLYGDPVIFAFDPYWGWFSGPIYDESVAVDLRYVAYRCYNALFVVPAWLFAGCLCHRELRPQWPVRRRDRLGVVVGAALILLGLSLFTRTDKLGFTASQRSMRGHLSLTRETEHFQIFYAPGTATAREIDLVAAEHEFAWHRLASKLDRQPEPPIFSYVFNSRETKRRLFGAGRTEVAPPWRGHLYLNHHDFPHQILHHELAHAFSKVYGDPVFGISLDGLSINGGLLEGFATALGPRRYGHLDLHDQAAILDRLDKRPGLAGLMGPGFWAKASSRAYTAAGSFSLWLLERQGAAKLGLVYGNGGDFEEVYGEPLRQLEAAWLAFLRARKLEEADVEALAERYRRRSIFARPCAHRVATLRGKINDALARGDQEAAVTQAEELCTLEPGQGRHPRKLSDIHGVHGDWREAIAVLAKALDEFDLSSTMRASYFERLADLSLRAGEAELAHDYYEQALKTHIMGSGRRRLQLKALTLQHAPAQAKGSLSRYFDRYDNDGSDRVVAIRQMAATSDLTQTPESAAFGHYLQGLQLASVSEYGAAISAYENCLGPERDRLPTPELRWFAHIKLVTALVATRQYTQAETELELLRNRTMANGYLKNLELWSERIAFYRAYLPATAP